MYKDRQAAGQGLSDCLKSLKLSGPLVLGIPRGGVVVGEQVALELKADLDIVIAKKIGAPFNPEFAVAAVDQDGYVTLSPGDRTYASPGYIEETARIVTQEIAERLAFFRQGRKAREVAGRDVVVVDDGLATGLTALAAIRYVRRLKPGKLVLAVPVSPEETLSAIDKFADEVVCPLKPSPFYAVGQWYDVFDQVTDEAVREILSTFQSQ
ncbi:MAG TPA: phosphoribosyltransferase [Firmicutes bacterium]|nr:phosphoribosyltransferase [Candidatus Fermentithermobacillaceae bacterium]